LDIVLLVSEDCTPCRNAERLWVASCAEFELPLRVLGIEENEGGELARRLGLNSVPVLVIDNRVASVGVPDAAAAKALLQSHAPDA